MATEYLGVKQVAERLGITSGGLLNLKLPEPDATIGRTRGWLPETIDEWNAQRPGRGVGGGDHAKTKHRYAKTQPHELGFSTLLPLQLCVTNNHLSSWPAMTCRYTSL